VGKLSVVREQERITLLDKVASRGSALVGLDIGTTAVKAARIRRRGDRVTVMGLARVGLESSSGASSAADEKIATAIWRCLRMLKGRGRVACSLAGPDVAVRSFEFPLLPRHQLPSAVELEAAQVCPFEISEASVSHQVLYGMTHGHGKGGQEERIIGYFAAAKNTVLQHRRSLCERGNALCAVMDVDGLALLNCLEACGLRKEGGAVMALNVGHTWTNLTIISENGLPFVRDIPYAGDQIVSRIARMVQAPQPAVVGALRGEKASEISRHKLQPAIHQACAALAERVNETLRYYGTRQTGPAVERVYLCGGLCLSGWIAKGLMSLLPARTQLWDPLAILSATRRVRKNLIAEYGPAFAVAIGLALRTLRDVHD
jgi:type IV pilus assembly protein PilM